MQKALKSLLFTKMVFTSVIIRSASSSTITIIPNHFFHLWTSPWDRNVVKNPTCRW